MASGSEHELTDLELRPLCRLVDSGPEAYRLIEGIYREASINKKVCLVMAFRRIGEDWLTLQR